MCEDSCDHPFSYSTKGVARLQFKRRKSGQVKRQRHFSRGAERDGVWGGGVSSPPVDGSGKGAPPWKIFLLFDLKMEHFGAVLKLDLTEETRTQLQEEEASAYACVQHISCLVTLIFEQ